MMMRVKRLALGVAGAMVFTGLLLAQQNPIQGCNAAMSCNQPKGFSTLTGNAGGNAFFGVGFRWGPGYEFRVVTPNAAPQPTPSMDTRIFHLRDVSLLPPSPTPTPVAPRSR
jgi:hypothetical protein